MKTLLQVLSEDERHRVHECTLSILAKTGVRVDTAQGRQILRDAGAMVDENTNIVRFPRTLVEESLRLAPKDFTLGARRPGWDLEMNAGGCTLLIDGEARFVLDSETGRRRTATIDDWLRATCLIDALDEVGLYWSMVEVGDRRDTMAGYVEYLSDVFSNFSKHVQVATSNSGQAPWLLEVLQVVFGDREAIRRAHPLSYLLCPQSPLIIEGPHTDAYLALLGWDIPLAVMPMPLMGATAPGSLIATTVIGNCEVLATLCTLQAAAPGTPFIYAPVLAVIDLRSGRYSAGAVEASLLGAACTEMGRYYGLPVEASGMGTDHHVPGIQAGYERALGGILPALSWPDILVGPGLLGGSMILSLEQLLIDVEVFRMYKRVQQGIDTDEDRWLEDVIGKVGPGGEFLSEYSTVKGIRGGEWYVSRFGVHETFEEWQAAGRPTLLGQAREEVDQLLANHEPLALDQEVERELARIRKRAEAEA
ncbi:MAG TPA: trimethylamine methyltransferase family protein [Anaerolineae bacterium]|nr:trimethylamine methyltransferase family protein [Anaerolineae bacterium]